MFIQVISGKVIDANLLNQQHERWLAELKPGASGYLGFTGGITADNRSISIARFESEAAAQANSERDEQGQWWDNTAGAYEGTPTFSNCTDADLLFGGGSNDAGFVQVIQGRAKDREATRKFMQEGQDQLRAARPDILGIVVAWHGDSNEFTQAVYFKSEADTRGLESATEGDEMRQRFQDMFEGPPTFYDLTEPILD
ncbi:MAG TPA: hypothetical protein VHA79_10360 [Mycobacteriales bacterium]|jgi:hypothetical protein|nr:hypothetical protein [Mycobacteriales bacterium]